MTYVCFCIGLNDLLFACIRFQYMPGTVRSSMAVIKDVPMDLDAIESMLWMVCFGLQKINTQQF